LSFPRLSPLGDSVLTVTFGEGIDAATNSEVVARARQLEDASIIGVSDVVPSYSALALHFDPTIVSGEDLRDRVGELLSQTAPETDSASTRLHRIPVRYDGEDLKEVASRTGLSVSDVIDLHSRTEYDVFVIGFVPGFAYLGILDERLALPRRDSPRKEVPAGSVAIAERQTGIYPSRTPGGWHLIGNADVSLFDVTRAKPALLAAGDRVKFEPA
jgi:KipI family sensor histidine kinase inhibitor